MTLRRRTKTLSYLMRTPSISFIRDKIEYFEVIKFQPLLIKNKVNRATETQLSNSSNLQKCFFSYQILDGKPVKNVQIEPQTTEILSTDLNVPLSVSDNLVREKL